MPRGELSRPKFAASSNVQCPTRPSVVAPGTGTGADDGAGAGLGSALRTGRGVGAAVRGGEQPRTASAIAQAAVSMQSTTRLDNHAPHPPRDTPQTVTIRPHVHGITSPERAIRLSARRRRVEPLVGQPRPSEALVRGCSWPLGCCRQSTRRGALRPGVGPAHVRSEGPPKRLHAASILDV